LFNCLLIFIYKSDTDFDFFWSEKKWHNEKDTQGYFHLGQCQKVNHYPNNHELTRKDHMYKNLRKYKRQLEKDGKVEEAKKCFNFFPQTFNMPGEYSLFLEEYKKAQNLMWIMKPVRIMNFIYSNIYR